MKQKKTNELIKGDIFTKQLKVNNRVCYKVIEPLNDNILLVENRNTGKEEKMVINENKLIIWLRYE